MNEKEKLPPAHPYDSSSEVGKLLVIAARFGVHPGPGFGLHRIRRFFEDAENRTTLACPRCGPQEHRTRFLEAEKVYRCRACGHRFEVAE